MATSKKLKSKKPARNRLVWYIITGNRHLGRHVTHFSSKKKAEKVFNDWWKKVNKLQIQGITFKKLTNTSFVEIKQGKRSHQSYVELKAGVIL